MPDKIWALFSIANDYDQPDADLQAWWKDKPTFDALAHSIGITVDKKKGDAKIGRLLQGQKVRIYDAIFRLENIVEGVYEYER